MTTKKDTTKSTIRAQKGEGSIYQEASGKWVAVIPASFETGGKMKKFSGKTRAIVAKKMKEYKESIRIGFFPQTEQYVDEFIKYWLYNVKLMQLKPTSFDRLESTVKTHIIPNIGNYKLTEITPDIIQQLVIDKMQTIKQKDGTVKSLSYSSIKKAHDILNSAFCYAVKRDYIYKNPMNLVSMPHQNKFDKKEIVYFNEKQIEKFYTVCKDCFGNGVLRHSYGYVFILMMYSGMRAGEALTLKWQDIDSKSIYIRGNVVIVRDRSEQKEHNDDNGVKLKYTKIEQKSAKTNHSTNREIPLNKKAIDALENIKAINLARFGYLPDYIVCSGAGQSITLSTFVKAFNNVISACDFKPCGTHTLRHTFASMLFRKGVDVKVISEILGHSNISITYNTYIHIIKEQKRIALNLIDDI